MASKQTSKKSYQIKVTLKGTRPPVWRRLVVPGEVFLDELHAILQVAMGWSNSHLHQFVWSPPGGGKRIASAELISLTREKGGNNITNFDLHGERVFSDPAFELECAEDETRIQLREILPAVKEKLRYDYDFGDSWTHEIVVEKITDAVKKDHAECIAGKRACPPEDCGGVWGYAELVEAMSDPDHERHEELKEWLGVVFDPACFDIAAVNAEIDKLKG